MRNLLALVGLAAIGLGGGGWYLGWYKFEVTKKSDGNIQIVIDPDTKKATTDSSEFLKNVGSVIGGHVDKAAQDAKTAAPASAPGGTPGPLTPGQPGEPNPVTPIGGTTGPIQLIPPK